MDIKLSRDEQITLYSNTFGEIQNIKYDFYSSEILTLRIDDTTKYNTYLYQHKNNGDKGIIKIPINSLDLRIKELEDIGISFKIINFNWR